MKKLFLIIAFFLGITLSANADVMPYYTSRIAPSSVGVYQATNSFKVFENPDEKSKILVEGSFDYKNYSCPISMSEMFVVFVQLKELAFFQVVDEEEDFYEITYCNGKRGWIKKEDAGRFLNWRAFYNLYGKKYGLYYMKDAPENTKQLHSAGDAASQVVSRINLASMVKLTAVKGNWAVVSIMDLDKVTKIGYIQWRNSNGEIYLFPAIK